MNLVAVDYSINSPGICLLKDGKPHFISYLKPNTGTKKEQKLQEEMGMLDDVTLIYQPEPDVIKQEMARVMRHRTIAEGLSDIIAEYTNPDEEYRIYFEGSSYGTSRFGTNSLIDLASASSIFKSYLIDRFNVTQLDVYAPTSIKKHVGKGNMKKIDMWYAFLSREEALKDSEFFKFCLQQKDSKKLMKPLDDLVDAYFILEYVSSL